MNLSVKKTRLLLATGVLFFLCLSKAGHAQTQTEASQLLNRLNQLENQMQTMSRAVFRGEKMPEQAPAPMPAETASSTAAFEIRLSQIEDQQRTLTGQLEKINFTLQKLEDRLTRVQADTEQRFQQQQSPVENQPASLAPPYGGGNTLGTTSAGSAIPGAGSARGNNPAEALYEAAFAHLRDAKYEEAEEGFKRFLSQYQGHPLSANAQYWLGEAYYVRGDFTQSAKSFAEGYQNFPQSAKAEDSLLKLSLSLSKLGRKDDACLSLRQLQKQFPDTPSPIRRRAEQEIKQLGCP